MEDTEFNDAVMYAQESMRSDYVQVRSAGIFMSLTMLTQLAKLGEIGCCKDLLRSKSSKVSHGLLSFLGEKNDKASRLTLIDKLRAFGDKQGKACAELIGTL